MGVVVKGVVDQGVVGQGGVVKSVVNQGVVDQAVVSLGVVGKGVVSQGVYGVLLPEAAAAEQVVSKQTSNIGILDIAWLPKSNKLGQLSTVLILHMASML